MMQYEMNLFETKLAFLRSSLRLFSLIGIDSYFQVCVSIFINNKKDNNMTEADKFTRTDTATNKKRVRNFY